MTIALCRGLPGYLLLLLLLCYCCYCAEACVEVPGVRHPGGKHYATLRGAALADPERRVADQFLRQLDAEIERRDADDPAVLHIGYWVGSSCTHDDRSAVKRGGHRVHELATQYNLTVHLGDDTPQGQESRELRGTAGAYSSDRELIAHLRALGCGEPDQYGLGGANGLMSIETVGRSVLGRDLYQVRMSKAARGSLTPKVRIAANIHGDEVVGRELVLRFAEYLCLMRSERRVDRLLSETQIYLYPSLNPDGFEAGTRENANLQDLNRDFPDQFTVEDAEHPRQPETRAVMDLAAVHNFTIGLVFHGGALLINYGFDGNRQHRSGQYTATTSDELFKTISYVYADANPDMLRKKTSGRGSVTNGASWYVLCK